MFYFYHVVYSDLIKYTEAKGSDFVFLMLDFNAAWELMFKL